MTPELTDLCLQAGPEAKVCGVDPVKCTNPSKWMRKTPTMMKLRYLSHVISGDFSFKYGPSPNGVSVSVLLESWNVICTSAGKLCV